MTEDQKCGTYAGYQAHRRRGEQTCEACRTACREYQRLYRRESGNYGRELERQAARERALSRLAAMHYGTYRILYQEECAGIEERERLKPGTIAGAKR